MEQLFTFIGNHPFLVGLFVVLLILFIRNEMNRGGQALTPQELVNVVNGEGAVVVDVRDNNEFRAGHIVDAINVPYSALESRLDELNKHKSKPVVIACKMGQHAGLAGAMMRKAGFEDVRKLKGGMTEWRNQSLPVVKGKS